METNLLKKSGIIAVIVTFSVLAFWFGFARLSMGIDTSNWTKYVLKKDSVIDEQIIIQAGTSGSGIVFGSTTGKWVGTPTDSTLARIYFNISSGQLEFKPSGTTTSFPFGSVTVGYLDANYATVGSLSTKLNAVAGTGTTNVFTDTTLAGQGTLTATVRANGVDISPTEISYLDGAVENIPTALGLKLTKVGTPTTYLNSVTAEGKTGTTSFSLSAGTNATVTSTLAPDGSLAVTVGVTGSASAKTDIQEGGTVTVSNATHLNFDSGYFDVSVDGAGARVALPAHLEIGTTTQWNGSTVTIAGSGTSPLSVVANRNYLGTNTTSIMTGTSTPTGQVLVSSTYSGNYHGYEAFDGIIDGGLGNGWAALGATNESITYNYGTGSGHGLRQYRITANITDVGGAVNSPNTFDLRGSNDNVTYTSIDARTGQSFSALETKTYEIATSTTLYQFYKLHIATINGGANTVIGELQLIGETGMFDAIHVNGSGTVLVGTIVPNSTSMAGYIFQVGGSGLATSWGVTCYESIKSIVGSGSGVLKKSYDAVMGTVLFEHHPKIRNDITLAQAEEIAKTEYVKSFEASDYETFKTDRLSEYLTDKGTDTANWARLREDFEAEYVEPRKDEFYVLSDKEERTKQKKTELESDTSITSITPVSDDPSTPAIFKRGDPRILDLQPQIGALMGTVQYQDAVIKNLESRLQVLENK